MALRINPREKSFPLVFGIICQNCGQYSEWKADTKEDIKDLRCQHCSAELKYDIEQAYQPAI